MLVVDNKTCAFVTLGCKVNQYDTQAIRERLWAGGYAEVGPDQAADLYVVNTCTVTGQSGAKSRKEIRKLMRRNPEARMVVTGCYAESDRAALEALGGIDLVVGNADKFDIPALLGVAMEQTPGIGEIAQFQGHTRAFMKVQDGCELGCTFCIIPAVRGKVRSKPLADAVAEADRLVAAEHREIVLTGIHLGAYGQDRPDQPDQNLAGLVGALESVKGLERVRLSSIEVNEIGDDLLAVMADSRKVCPHLHLPLQSGDDTVLKRMGRNYTIKTYRETVERIKNCLDRPTFTTDIIVGFPGETEEQFGNSLRLCREIGFMKLHVFPYSVRDGTPAARMTNFVTAPQIERRTQRMLDLSDELGLAHGRTLVGSEVEILVERGDGSNGSPAISGLTRRYERVVIDNATAELDNRTIPVRIDRAEPKRLFGSIS